MTLLSPSATGQGEEELAFTRKKFRRRFRKRRGVPLRVLFPNAITLLGLAAGLTSIRMAIEGRYELSIWFILTAAVMDGLDGRVARMLNATTRIGRELDSLADFVSFGVAPAIILFTWTLLEIRSLGWLIVMIYAIGIALRLARFNVAPVPDVAEKWRENYFDGVPSPAGALLVLAPLYFQFLEPNGFRVPTPAVLIYASLIALLCVSWIPTFSFKKLGDYVEFRWVLPFFLIGIGYVGLLFTYTYYTLLASAAGYLLSIPFSYLRYNRILRQKKAQVAEVKT